MCSGIETFGKNAVVCGRSKNVGLPIAMLLHSSGVGETGACKSLPPGARFATYHFTPTRFGAVM